METVIPGQTNNSRLHSSASKPSALNLLKCKCPRCRQGNMFQYANPWNLKRTMTMHTECAVCRQPFNIEVGFYYGSSYVSYALTVAISVASFIAWWVFVGISVNDNRVLYWLPVNAVLLLLLQPYLMRLARTGWLAFFIPYDKDWKINPPKQLERVNKDQENNW
jgi:uncharacterized protein (DUF983 family)